jgi:NAD(P)-dependent dehydrogenase (short-subunit alcohol dehydrogenase family)
LIGELRIIAGTGGFNRICPCLFLFLLICRRISDMSVQSIHAFAEKVALVTDGSGPVGRAAAIQLALQGCYVIVVFDPEDENSGPLLSALESLGTLARTVSADVSTSPGIDKVVSEVRSSFGRLDYLVNCLKIEGQSSFEDTGEPEFDAGISNGLRTPFMIARAFVPLMNERPKPKIVNVWTRRSEQSDPLTDVVYAAAEAFTRSLSRAVAPHFRVNGVSVRPGTAVRAGLDPELFPSPGSAKADDAARMVLFLLSPEAVGVGGQVIEVDG